VEGNDPHGGHGRVCEGDGALVEVGHGMVEVRLLDRKNTRNGVIKLALRTRKGNPRHKMVSSGNKIGTLLPSIISFLWNLKRIKTEMLCDVLFKCCSLFLSINVSWRPYICSILVNLMSLLYLLVRECISLPVAVCT
jgi:hypothetical protein